MLIKTNEYYEQLFKSQGTAFSDLDIKSVLDSLAYAGRNDDYDNAEITFSDNNKRSATLFSVEYYADPDTMEEFAVVFGQNGKRFDVPLERNGELNYQGLNNRMNQLKKQYGDIDLYIDNAYLRERGEAVIEPEIESEAVNATNNYIKNHARTKLGENNYTIDLKEVAAELEKNGYPVKIKRGGHLLVQDRNLSVENSITITRKNAYIEDANLQSEHAVAIYEEMKEAVLKAAEHNFNEQKEKEEIMNGFVKIGDVSVVSVVKDLVQTHIGELAVNPELTDFENLSVPREKHQFLDKNKNEYMSFSLVYEKDELNETMIKPMVEVSYGKEYGEYSKRLEITGETIHSINAGNFYKTDLAREINDIASIGFKDHDTKIDSMKLEGIRNNIEKAIKKEFHFMSDKKQEYFVNTTLDYYKDKQDKTLSEYQKEKLIEAPFYNKGMSNGIVMDVFDKTFSKLQGMIRDPEIEKLSHATIDLKDFSNKIIENGEVVFDSLHKDPVTYDREWLTKLARLQDSLTDLRYGPIQDAIEIGKSMTRGAKEFVEGIAKYEQDGIIRSGFDMGNGIISMRDGWKYGTMISAMEKEYQNLLKSENENDRIMAIDKKMDLKLLRNDIQKNCDIYVKASIALKETCDKMMSTVSKMIDDKKENIMADSKLKSIKNEFRKLSQTFVDNYNKANQALSQVNKNLLNYMETAKNNAIHFGQDIYADARLKAKTVELTMRDKFNRISKQAQALLTMTEFTKNKTAELLNDIRVEQVFSGLNCEEFNKQAKTRFWDELDKAIDSAEALKELPFEERTPEDNSAIRFGNMMRMQKEQNLFVAEQLNKEIRQCYKEKLSYSETIERLAKTYNNEAMTYRLRNSEDLSVKSYSDLSEVSKQICKEVIEELLHNMPAVEEQLKENEKDIKHEKDMEKEENNIENDMEK